MTKNPWSGKWVPGVLSKNQMRRLIGSYIKGIEKEDFDKFSDASSIDLRLSKEGWNMKKGSIKPCGSDYEENFLNNKNFAERLKPEKDGSFLLQWKECYAFRLQESLAPGIYGTKIYGQATAKSSVGRVDVIARLIIDGQHQYDYFDPNHTYKASGNMFVEIIPISFGVKVKEGTRVTQIRFFYGEIEKALITEEEFIKDILVGSQDGKGFLSVDLNDCEINGHKVCAFRARKDIDRNCFIPLWDAEQKPNPCDYWEFKKSEDSRLRIETDRFYLIRSKERISLPPGVAVYARAMDESLGEMRIHYAGFVHPFFGYQRPDGKGTPLIFEVRGHNIDVNLKNGERLAKLMFYRMSEPADPKKDRDKDSTYGRQELQLSKYFPNWPKKIKVDKKGRVTERRGKK